MNSRASLVWLMVGVVLLISRLAAQDVTVTDPAWFDPENPPADQPPQFKKRPKLDYPEELKKSAQVAYAIVEQTIGIKGERLNRPVYCSNPYLGKVIEIEEKFSPAMRKGKKVEVNCWYAVIFNPRSASVQGAEATARLLAVAPTKVDKKDLPRGLKMPPVIWATVSLNDKGELRNFVFDEPAFESVRPQVGGSLYGWRFAPARQEGQAIASELHVPLVIHVSAQSERPPGSNKPPQVLSQVAPKYPMSLRRSGLVGKVLVVFIVDKTGAVKNPVVVESNNPGFNEAALEAILKWKFKPGLKGTEPVECGMNQWFVFDFGGYPGRELMTVTAPEKKKQKDLPPELQCDIPPQTKGVLVPVYPYPLFRDGVGGKVVVLFLVDADGRVSELKVLEATKPEFGLAMTAAVEAFSFTPALKDGKPTKALMKMEQGFPVEGSDANFAIEDKKLLTLEKKHPEKILSPKQLDGPLKPISRPQPKFPLTVSGRMEQGSAKIEMLIDAEGRVRLPRVVEATDPAFGYAAVQAVIDWRFEPPKADGKEVVVRLQVPFRFAVKPTATKEESPSSPALEEARADAANKGEEKP